MDFHGAPLSRTWVRLGAGAKMGDTAVDARPARDGLARRRPRDHHRHPAHLRADGPYTEDRIVTAIDGTKVTLDQPLKHVHLGDGTTAPRLPT